MFGREQKKKSAHEAPLKVWTNVVRWNPISATECKTCGTVFDVAADPHRVTASHARIIDDGQAYVIDHHITDVTYSPHRKLGKPDSLMVSYWSGIKRVPGMGVSRPSWLRTRAEAWWESRRRDYANDGQLFVPG